MRLMLPFLLCHISAKHYISTICISISESGNSRSGSDKVRHRNKERNPFTDILMPAPLGS